MLEWSPRLNIFPPTPSTKNTYSDNSKSSNPPHNSPKPKSTTNPPITNPSSSPSDSSRIFYAANTEYATEDKPLTPTCPRNTNSTTPNTLFPITTSSHPHKSMTSKSSSTASTRPASQKSPHAKACTKAPSNYTSTSSPLQTSPPSTHASTAH